MSPARGEAALPPLARREVFGVAAVVAGVLMAFSARYGYHRDELYFLDCGRHLAWGYPDQPPLVPLLARLMSDISSTSLVVLRLPSAVATAATLCLTGLTARELGGGRSAQLLAVGATGMSYFVLGAGHLLSTTTIDLPFEVAVVWLSLRAVRTGNGRLWLAVGATAGIGLLANDLVGFIVLGLVVGVLLAGPRDIFRSSWLYAGGLIMAALWSPYLVWQARHGWPQLTIARAIANGSSGTSEPRWAFLPFQLVLPGIFITPVWVTGLVRLLRSAELRWARAVAVAWIALAVIFIATGGKPYYILGLLPALLAAGAPAVVRWMAARSGQRRLLGAAVVLQLVGLPVVLPILPLSAVHDSPIVALNYDAGETIAWPTYVREIAAVTPGPPLGVGGATQILASNYGEAGAVDRYGGRLGLAKAHGVQNANWVWGPPPSRAREILAVGFSSSRLTPYFTKVELVALLNNHLGVDDDEQGAPVWLCSGRRQPWSTIWPKLRRYG
jgi:hypothetical protein